MMRRLMYIGIYCDNESSTQDLLRTAAQAMMVHTFTVKVEINQDAASGRGQRPGDRSLLQKVEISSPKLGCLWLVAQTLTTLLVGDVLFATVRLQVFGLLWS